MADMERLTLAGEGVNLAADAMGPVDGQPILFLPGGGQTRQSWGNALPQAARRGYRGYAIDMRGHGDSGWSSDGVYQLDRFVGDIRRVVADLGRTPVIVGASMGGLTGLAVAGSPPPELAALVLVDVTPRIEPEGAREISAFMHSAPEGFASVEEAADAVAAYLPHRKRPKDVSGLRRNLRLRDDGRYRWHWDPAFVKLTVEAGELEAHVAAHQALNEQARSIRIPTLLIRGGRSRIVSQAAVDEFLGMVPHAEFVDIPAADHMVAGDANDAFNDAAFAFVDRVVGAG